MAIILKLHIIILIHHIQFDPHLINFLLCLKNLNLQPIPIVHHCMVLFNFRRKRIFQLLNLQQTRGIIININLPINILILKSLVICDQLCVIFRNIFQLLFMIIQRFIGYFDSVFQCDYLIGVFFYLVIEIGVDMLLFLKVSDDMG